MNTDKLPEKWCIKQTEETYQIINYWLNKGIKSVNYYKGKNLYVHYPNDFSFHGFNSGNHAYNCIKSGYKEITFEQFKKYVLEEQVVSEINNNYQIF